MKKLLALILSGITVLSLSMVTLAAGHCVCPTDRPDCQCMVLIGSSTNGEITMNGYGHPDDCKCGTTTSENTSENTSDSALVLYRMILENTADESHTYRPEDTDVPMPTIIAANAENKSVGEYMNNAVTSTPGLPKTTPVAQGGDVIVDGLLRPQTFAVKKVLPAHVNSIKSHVSAIEGTVLNCVDIDGSLNFDTAVVNFYMPGIVSGQNIQVYHLSNGGWSPLNVTEIREDHVVVEMTSYGIIAFVEVPAETSAEPEAPVEIAEAEVLETPTEAEVLETSTEAEVLEAPTEAEMPIETPVETVAEVPAE